VAIRVGRAYQVGYQTFRASSTADGTLGLALENGGELCWWRSKPILYLNGVRIRMTRNSLRHHQAALKEFSRRKIADCERSRRDPRRAGEIFRSLPPARIVQLDVIARGPRSPRDVITFSLRSTPRPNAQRRRRGVSIRQPGRVFRSWTPPSNRDGARRSAAALRRGRVGAPGLPRAGGPRTITWRWPEPARCSPHGASGRMEMRHAKRRGSPLVDGASRRSGGHGPRRRSGITTSTPTCTPSNVMHGA